MDFIQGFDRHQIQMISFDSLLRPDSWARVVDYFVDALPLAELGFRKTPGEEGRPPYAPGDLLKLYLYGYKNGLRSSRKLAEACEINMEVIWLMRGLRPSARKIAYFRKENARAFKQAFRHFVRVLREMDLIDGQTIAIDSFKIRAQNSLKRNFNEKKIGRHLAYIDEKIEEYEEALEREEDPEKQEELSDKIVYQEQKREGYERLGERLRETGETQISLTDRDARAVVLHRNVVNVGYNIQAATDSKYKLFVSNDTGTVNDTHALSPMALNAKELLGVDQMNVLSDKGYTTGKHIQRCVENGITTYSSPKEHSSQHNGLFDMQIFEYDEKNDSYICPAGETLDTNGRIYNKGGHLVKHYKNRRACKNCTLRNQCTRNKNGRFIERSIYQEALEENQKRVEENPDYYRLRQEITEHPFGTLKRQWGFTYTLMKGKEQVLSEVNLLMICYNLRRMMTILGTEELKKRLRALVFVLMGSFGPKGSDLRPIFKRSTLLRAA